MFRYDANAVQPENGNKAYYDPYTIQLLPLPDANAGRPKSAPQLSAKRTASFTLTHCSLNRPRLILTICPRPMIRRARTLTTAALTRRARRWLRLQRARQPKTTTRPLAPATIAPHLSQRPSPTRLLAPATILPHLSRRLTLRPTLVLLSR
eukprot:3344414-Pleurochrysis_carterae.AAC.1